MITSMTGFASVLRERDEVAVNVTVRAVNHRFLDIQVRIPSALGHLEAILRAQVQKRISRGRIEVSVTVQDRRRAAVEVTLNEGLLEAVSAKLGSARDRGLLIGDLTPADVLRLPDGLTIRDAAASNTDSLVASLVEETAAAAIGELDGMRRREGAFLEADLESRRLGLADTIALLAAVAQEGDAGLEARLSRRVHDLALETSPDPALLAQEIVRFVARSDVSEEVVRFRAHLEHWAILAAGPEPCGRKLDFLLQEMNREINTIGSKAEGTRAPELIVHAKAELEKMREQVQNVE